MIFKTVVFWFIFICCESTMNKAYVDALDLMLLLVVHVDLKPSLLGCIQQVGGSPATYCIGRPYTI